ncbi:MAG: DUF2147 domain-containing protein [Cyclobacteriaceae bacterium]|nr:DUF2147 domain-containing protein [Cyclobacteriaceae bacterium]
MTYSRILTAFFLLVSGLAVGQNDETILGRWKTIDDNTGEARSIVEILEHQGAVVGRVVKIFPRPNVEPDPVCDKCSPEDPRYKKKIIGMEIIRNLKKSGSEYGGGDILDPENGKVYRSKIWVEGKVLKVRGYWGPFYRTQTWQRVD